VTDFSGFQLVIVFPSSCTVNIQPTANLALLGLPNNVMRPEKILEDLSLCCPLSLTLFLERSYLFLLKYFLGFCLKVRDGISESYKELLYYMFYSKISGDKMPVPDRRND
jgi:hypothetical protein